MKRLIDGNTEHFYVFFEHLISPEILLYQESEDSFIVEGKVKISVDQMIHNFTSGLGLKNLFDKIVQTNSTDKGYFLTIKDIADAGITIRDYKLYVNADYKPSKEWWAKPVALVALSKILNDFAGNVEKSGILPGFRNSVKDSMQQLRKGNFASLALKDLFEKQYFYTKNLKVFINKFNFESVKTSSENGRFVISFKGKCNTLVNDKL
jgi:hypothetical protein